VEWHLLEGVPAQEIRRLLSVARRRRFSKGEVVFHRDDPGDSLHLVQKGRFAIRIMTPLGDTVTIGVRGPGDSFGEMALVGGEARRSATVEALEEAETFSVYKDDFARLRKEHPTVTVVLVAFLAGEVRRQNELLLDALYISAEKRVLRRLDDLVAVYGESDQAVVPLSQEELAQLAGTSRATVNRVLRNEEERGTLRLERRRTIVVDREVLARRAR
jgi:CRP/FNR family cyclic AMP-dependent transcriptional regulator